MQITFECDGYRATILPESHYDIACHWRTYGVKCGKAYKEFHLENEYKDDNSAEFRRRFYEIVEIMKQEKEQPKMTREDFKDIISKIVYPNVNDIIKQLEKSGLLKFDEPKKPPSIMLFEFADRNCKWTEHYNTVSRSYGTVRLEEWPEGLVLWVGGVIVWKSWINYYKKGDAVTIDYYDGLRHEKQKQAGIIS